MIRRTLTESTLVNALAQEDPDIASNIEDLRYAMGYDDGILGRKAEPHADASSAYRMGFADGVGDRKLT